MLDVSRIITGKLLLTLMPIDLLPVIDAAIDAVLPPAKAKGIKILSHIDSQNLIVNGDAERLQQVAWNLLSNAVKFSPDGGEVEVSVGREGSYAKIMIADTGPGIDPEFLPHAFERFTQADRSTTRKHGGLGLGLAIVRHLVELHGGTVEARNREGNKGAIFTVTLPASS
jgi:signal transduction histidine kinase